MKRETSGNGNWGFVGSRGTDFKGTGEEIQEKGSLVAGKFRRMLEIKRSEHGVWRRVSEMCQNNNRMWGYTVNMDLWE